MLAENTLLKTAYHFLLLLVGFDTLTYRKDYDRSPILVGHQVSFLAPLPGSVAPLESGMTPKFDCVKSFMDTDIFRKFSTKYGLDSEIHYKKRHIRDILGQTNFFSVIHMTLL